MSPPAIHHEAKVFPRPLLSWVRICSVFLKGYHLTEATLTIVKVRRMCTISPPHCHCQLRSHHGLKHTGRRLDRYLSGSECLLFVQRTHV